MTTTRWLPKSWKPTTRAVNDGHRNASAAALAGWTVAPSTNTPYGFGRWLGETGEPAHAAYWQSRKADMIDHLTGWLETHTADDAERKAAQGLFDQLTQTDGMTNEQWRYGI